MKVLNIILISITSIMLILLIYVGGLYMGYLPIPKIVTNIIAENKGLTAEESEKLNKVANVYQILKIYNPDEIQSIEEIIIKGGNQEDIIKYSVENYNNISDETFTIIGGKFEMDSIDILLNKQLLDNIVENYKLGNIEEMNKDIDSLQELNMKYDLDYNLIYKIF